MKFWRNLANKNGLIRPAHILDINYFLADLFNNNARLATINGK
jgi:hypothetical protein